MVREHSFFYSKQVPEKDIGIECEPKSNFTAAQVQMLGANKETFNSNSEGKKIDQTKRDKVAGWEQRCEGKNAGCKIRELLCDDL